ncbi:DUF4381 domain-containing protein [Legionella saoudiensis]|uniref:DUF4381 domain-containing protein n=1 Tax=Legionella saoudiensis TaxID=1750561 RepID=UPI00072FAA87|nr:DUF4381 domain-containing protein [Legionella saoudiensis]
MANQNDPLAQLKDIHLPDAIGWWPLAPGWYAVMLLSVLLLLILAFYLRRRWRYALAKKQALVLLAAYQESYEKEHNAPISSAQISELLRRVALVYYPRAEVASLYGDAWLQFLKQTSKGIDFDSVRTLLLDAPFKAADTRIDLRPLFDHAKQWIKQRGIPCSH